MFLAGLLIVMSWMTPSFAQVETEGFERYQIEVIDAYRAGQLTSFSAAEREIITQYYDSLESTSVDQALSLLNDPLYFEGFDDIELPAGWQNVDESESGFIWEFVESGTYVPTSLFEGGFAAIDSDAAGSGVDVNASLITDPISVTGLSNVSLTFDHLYRHLGADASASVSLSNDGGESWQEVVSYTSTQGDVSGFSAPFEFTPVTADFDVTSLVDGAETIQVKFEYDDGGAFAWFWLFDNVAVYEPAAEPSPVVLQSPANEAEGLSNFVTLNWSQGSGAAPTEYDVYFGTNPDPAFAGTVTETSWDTPELDWSTTYYWYVVASNDAGSAGASATWSFTTQDDPTIDPPFTVDFTDFPPENWERPYGILSEDTEFISSPISVNWIAGNFNNNPDNDPSARINVWLPSTATSPLARWLISPPIDMGDGSIDYELLFDIAVTEWNNQNSAQLGPDDYFAVVASVDGGATWSSENVVFELSGAEGDEVAEGGQSVAISLAGVTGTAKIAFYAQREVGETPSDPDLHFHVGDVRMRVDSDSPVLVVNPDELDFGSIFTGNSASLDFTVLNDGLGTMSGEVESDNMLFSGDFEPFSLEPGETADYTVTFDPGSTAGEQTGTITVTADGAVGSPATVSLVGEALQPPMASVNPESFDVTAFTGEETSRMFTISNDGEADLEFNLGINYADPANRRSVVPQTFFYENRGQQIESSTAAIESPGASVMSFGDSDLISFEEEEGFAPGFIGGQNNWTVFAGNESQPAISPARASDGIWSLELAEDPAAGGNVGAFSPLFSVTDEVVLIEQDVYIEALGGSDYDVIVQTPSQEVLLARVNFSWLGGGIRVLDDPEGTLVFVTTDQEFPVGEWFTIGVESNSTDETINYYYNGELFYEGNLFAGDSPEQLVYLHDNFNEGEAGYIDNIRISTEEGPTQWLSADVASGVIPGGSSETVNLSFDTSVDPGVYAADLIVTNNDPDNSTITVPVDFTLQGSAQVQVIHNAADPALAEVDVYVNGELFASNFPFRGATEYLTVPANEELTLEITAPESSEALLTLEATPEADQVLAVIAQGVADPSGFAPNPDGEDIGAELVVLDERQIGAPDEDTFSFYVFHGATDAPAVDIFVRELDANILEDVPYGTGSGYFDVEEGTYAIEVRAAGASSAVAVFFADVEGLGGLSAGILASGFLSPEDNMDGEAFALVVVLEDGTVVTLDGVSGPVLALTPAELEFGDVVEGFDSTLPVTFTNLGASNLALLDVEIDNDVFSIDFEDAAIISAGGSATYNVTFAPDAEADFTGELSVSSNDPDSPTTIALSGSGILSPGFAVDPDEIEATLAAGESDTFELIISNEGNGELEFAFPAYIMERILDGTDREFDAVRDRMIIPIRSAFENTEEARSANLERIAANINAGNSPEDGTRMVQSDNDASLMNEDGFLIEFEGLTLDGGEFITITDGLSGELTAVAADFVIDAADGGTWANDFGILFTTEELATGEEVDPATVLLQVGGLTTYGPAGSRIAWGTGSSGSPGTPVVTTIDIPTPLDLSGVYVSIGHAWTPGGVSTWSGNVNLIGVTEGADFITEVVPATGVIAPGNSEVITLTLDAADLIGGVYSGVLGVETNDPANFSVDIPATLTVEGEAEIALDPAELDFGTVVIGNDATESVTVSNTGNDVLSVTGFSTDNEQFVVETSAFDLEPGEMMDVMVTFAPDASGSSSATLTFESNVEDASVALSGEGQEPGILAFDPESLDLQVNVGENGTVTFTMTNDGVAPFDYSLAGGLVENGGRILAPAGSVTDINVPEQPSQRGESAGEFSYNTSAPEGISSRGIDSGVMEADFPFVNRGILDEEVVLTHSVSQEVVALTGVSCPTAPNSYIRTYSLPDFDIDGDFSVTAVQFGVESVEGSMPVEARIYTLDGALTFSNMTLLSTSVPVTISSADDLSVVTIPVESEVPAGSTIVVEVFAEVAGIFPGANSAGETAPSYVAGPGCNIPEPTPYAELDFPDTHLVLNVVGEAGDGLFTFEPSEGTIEAGQTVEVVADAQTFELEAGSYNAEIQITTNSPATPMGVIPVSIEVMDEDLASEMITFQVDMTVQEEMDVFRPDLGDEVYVRGGFNDWSVIEGDEMVDDGSGVFTFTYEVFGEAGDTEEYKYYIMAGDGRELPNEGWELDDVGQQGSNNRVVELIGEDQTLDVVFFNDQPEPVSLEPGDLPVEFALNQNYPNPFNPTTNIEYALPEAAEVTLEVFNLQGQRVAVLVNGQQNAGTHTVTFDANRLASGMYLYRIQAGSFTQVQKMMLVK